jgi:uncharacterized membrane protein
MQFLHHARLALALFTVALLALAAPQTASAQQPTPTRYTFFDLPGSLWTFADGINDQGQIMGNYYNPGSGFLPNRGFLYDRGVYTTLEFPGAGDNAPYGINNRGQLVGWYCDSAFGVRGFVLDHGVYTVLDAPGAVSGWWGKGTYALGINARGVIVGFASVANDDAPHSFVLSR